MIGGGKGDKLYPSKINPRIIDSVNILMFIEMARNMIHLTKCQASIIQCLFSDSGEVQ